MNLPSRRGLKRSDRGRDELDLRVLGVLFNQLPAMIAYWDHKRRNVFANVAYLDWFGLTPQQMRGMHMRQVLGQQVYDANAPYIDATYAGEEQLFDRTLVDQRGRVRHTQASYVPDRVDGKVVGMFVLVTDVTPRAEARRQMDEAQRMAHLGSWTWIIETGEMTWSDECYRIFGVDRQTFEPRRESVIRLVHPQDVDAALAFASEARVAGKDYKHTFRIVRPNGEVRDIEAHGNLSTDPAGRTVRIDGFYQDITETNASARELSRINRLNTDVIGMLGHDVRSPLTVILGYLEELEENWDGLDDRVRRSMISRVRGSAKRAARLVNDILTFASAQSGAIRPSPREVRLEHLLNEILDDLPGGNEVALQMEDSGAWLHVDPFHLRQIISNLVSNALRYGAPPVSVQCVRDGDQVVIRVQDNGPGVPPEVLGTLYERFATSSQQAQHRGTGLGLYLVQQLVTANGGTIEYHAPHQGGLTTFEVRLPLA